MPRPSLWPAQQLNRFPLEKARDMNLEGRKMTATLRTRGQTSPLGPVTGLSSLHWCPPMRHPRTRFPRWDLVTCPLPSPLGGYLCPGPSAQLFCGCPRSPATLPPCSASRGSEGGCPHKCRYFELLQRPLATPSGCGQLCRDCSWIRPSGVHGASATCPPLCWALETPRWTGQVSFLPSWHWHCQAQKSHSPRHD